MVGCDDKDCCPSKPKRLTPKERYLDHKLGFLRQLAEMYYLSGEYITSVVIPAGYLKESALPTGNSVHVYCTDYSSISITIGHKFEVVFEKGVKT